MLHKSLDEFELGAGGADARVLALRLEPIQSEAVDPGSVVFVQGEASRFGLDAEASRALILQEAGHELGLGAAQSQLRGFA